MPQDWTDIAGATILAVAAVVGVWVWIRFAAWIASVI
jgi:hypothetical protein